MFLLLVVVYMLHNVLHVVLVDSCVHVLGNMLHVVFVGSFVHVR